MNLVYQEQLPAVKNQNVFDPLLNNLEMQTYHLADGDLCNIFWVMNHTNESLFKYFLFKM